MILETFSDKSDGIELRGAGRDMNKMCGARQEELLDCLVLICVDPVLEEDGGGAPLAMQLLAEPDCASAVGVGIQIVAEVERKSVAGVRDARCGVRRSLQVRGASAYGVRMPVRAGAG